MVVGNNKGSLQDNFSWSNGRQSFLENKEGALASDEPLYEPFTWRHNGYVGVNAFFFRNKREQLTTTRVKTLHMEIRYEKRINKNPNII